MLRGSALALCLLLVACSPMEALGPADTPTAWPGQTETYVYLLAAARATGTASVQGQAVGQTEAPTVLPTVDAVIGVVAVASDTPAPTEPATEAPPVPATPKSTVGKIGQSVVSSGMSVLVLKVFAVHSIDSFLEAAAGNVYFVADVSVTNVGQDSVPYNSLYFSARDASGFQYNSAIIAPEPSFKSGELGPGQKTRGNVAFEVPQHASGVVMTYEPLVLFGGFEPIQIALGSVPAPQ